MTFCRFGVGPDTWTAAFLPALATCIATMRQVSMSIQHYNVHTTCVRASQLLVVNLRISAHSKHFHWSHQPLSLCVHTLFCLFPGRSRLEETSLKRTQWGSSVGRDLRRGGRRGGTVTQATAALVQTCSPSGNLKLTIFSNTGCRELPYTTNTPPDTSLTPSIGVGTVDP